MSMPYAAGRARTDPGRMPDATSMILDESECRELLTSAMVGRVAFAGPAGLRLLPVNYRVLNGSVCFRTSETSSLAVLAREPVHVLFEVDYHNATFQHGWSVLVAGTSGPVESPTLQDQLVSKVTPWAGGKRAVLISIEATRVTGRRVRVRQP